MKALTLTSILLFLLSATHAQVINKDWSPFPFGQVGYYTDITKSFYTISADSMRVNGNDTLWFINRKLFPGEALCTQPGATTWKNSPFSFSMDSFLVRGDTVLFYEDSLTLSAFNFNQPLNVPLNINTTCDNFLYVYDSAYYDAALNDSVKVISVPYTLPSFIGLNSKHHGLLYFQLNDNFVVCGTGNTYDLCGFKNDSVSWGFHPPTAKQYFNYYPGDILEFYDYDYAMNYQTLITYERDSVISVTQSDSDVTLNVFSNIVEREWVVGQDTMDIYKNTQQSINYSIPTGELLRTNNQPSQDGIDGVHINLYTDTSGCLTDTILEVSDVDDYSIINCQVTGSVNDISNINYYSTIFGWKSWHSDNFGGYEDKKLIGYKSPTKNFACGQYYPLGVKSVSNEILMNLFPNPCSDILNISGTSPNESIIIYDMLGKERKKIISNNSSSPIDVSNLESGIYILRGLSSTKEEEAVFSVIH